MTDFREVIGNWKTGNLAAYVAKPGGVVVDSTGNVYVHNGETPGGIQIGGPTPAAGSFTTLTGSVTATGSTTARTLANRAADVANILDYGGGIGGDDALAMRNAIASGKQIIYVPPGSYTCESTVATWGTAADPSCFTLDGLTNTYIIAYGATFNVANSISASVPVIVSFTNNCKHCGILGGTLVGNDFGLTSNQENVGIDMDSVTDITIRDVKFTGNFLTAISGVYIFDSVIENCQGFDLANPFDVAFLENFTVRRCIFWANPSNPVSGINIHYDNPTSGDNDVTYETGSSRGLIGGNTNNVRILDCIFDGFGNGVAVDAVSGMLISRTIIRNGLVASSANAQSGILIYRGAAAVTAGKTTGDIMIEDCDIFNNGVTAGGGTGCGIYIGTGSGTITDVTIRNNRIYDNTASGIASANTASVIGLTVMENDFRSRSGGGVQTAGILAALATAMPSNSGVGRNNIGQTPIGVDEQHLIANLTNINWQDASGNTQPIMGVNGSNVMFLRPASAAANIALQSYGGSTLLTIDSGGNVITAGVAVNSTTGFNGPIGGTTPAAGTFTAVTTPTILGSGTNATLALVPNGTGAIAAAVADSTTVGGNARGTNAVDFQTTRQINNQVASGPSSIVLGGSNNTASGSAAVAGGTGALASATGAVAIGYGPWAAGNYSAAFGNSSTDRGFVGRSVYASSPFANHGDAQVGLQILRAVTTNTTPTRLTADGNAAGTANTVNLPNNCAYSFQVEMVGLDTTTAGNYYRARTIDGLVTRGASASTTAVATGGNAGALSVGTGSTASYTVTADTTNGGVNITVTAPNTDTWHWVARVSSTEVQ